VFPWSVRTVGPPPATGTAPPPLSVLTRGGGIGEASDGQPEGRLAQEMGNAQTTPGGDLFAGWAPGSGP